MLNVVLAYDPFLFMNGLITITAYTFDLFFGDPSWPQHPVPGISLLIHVAESVLRQIVGIPRTEKIAGVVPILLVDRESM
jgi:cobalamin biosynthesis protein CobD/CbiB